MTIDVSTISHCPRCTSANYAFFNDRRWRCADCDFVYFHNIAAACAVILTIGDQLLLTVRKNDPDESVEAAVVREVKEELGIGIDRPRYLASYPNRYLYREVEYRTLDLIFTADVSPDVKPVAADDGGGDSFRRFRGGR